MRRSASALRRRRRRPYLRIAESKHVAPFTEWSRNNVFYVSIAKGYIYMCRLKLVADVSLSLRGYYHWHVQALRTTNDKERENVQREPFANPRRLLNTKSSVGLT
ncbi:hypothetical protein M0804_001025 [Polistes exclamans]|nr:hypothetical protein M0804_001025 [Polistes exclamans]